MLKASSTQPQCSVIYLALEIQVYTISYKDVTTPRITYLDIVQRQREL